MTWRRSAAEKSFLICFSALMVTVPALAKSDVPNPSFEAGQGKEPTGWAFHGAHELFAEAWTSDEPFDGKRALRLDARHGTVRWDSRAFQLRSNQQYLLCWQTRFYGEKSWRFRAQFCGIEVLFYDKVDRVIDSSRQHTSCWVTRGWQPGWFLFMAPANVHSVRIRFGIETKEPLPGGFNVDAVELNEWPLHAPAANSKLSLLSLKIEDERGEPAGARIRIARARGEPIRPPGAISYEQADGAFHPLEEGACDAVLPRGKYFITATKGFEYDPWEREVEIKQLREKVAVRLHRRWDWRPRGWFAGDHHTHLFRHGGTLFPSLQWVDALRVARCEGLDFLPFMGADRYPTQERQCPSSAFRKGEEFVYELTEEITEDFWGHVCPIGVSPQARSDRRYHEGPMHLDRYAAIAGSGGALSYGHPHGPLEKNEDLEPVARTGMGHVAREFPIDLALGMPCAIDLLAMEGPRNQLERKLRDLYRLWNLGFRPAVAASTDFHIDQGRQPIGSVRTYVRSGALDMPAIAEAYRSGHTFATSGPLIDLRVGGAGPGDELRLPASGEQLEVKVEAVSIGSLERVEIIVNGQICKIFNAEQPNAITALCYVKAERSLWIAARVYGLKDRHLASELEGRSLGAPQFAHTTPVYVLVSGKPIFAAEPLEADYFVRWCDAVKTAWGGNDPVITARLAEARKIFIDLMGQSSASRSSRQGNEPKASNP